MPQYSKTTWVDGTAPAISAANLNKLEQGVFDSIRQDGSTTMSAQFVTIAGSAATPAIAPTGDANTGIFFPAADTIAFGEGGTEAMRIDSNGYVAIGATSAGAAKLRVEDASSAKIYSVRTGGATLNFEGGSSAGFLKTITNHNLNLGTNNTEHMTITTAGNVGIGTTAPTNKLQIDGVTANTSCINAIANTTTGQSFGIALSAGSNSSDYALNIRNAAQTSQLFHITGAGNVGIGTTSPSAKLDVRDGSAVSTVTSFFTQGNSDAGFRLGFSNGSGSSANSEQGALVFNYTTTRIGSIGFERGSSANCGAITFNVASNNEKMRLNVDGYLLIGYTSSNGAYPLQVNGQIFATSSTIATSDGKYKKDVVALDGALDIVTKLNPVQFSWKEHPVHKFNTDVPTVGFIAQEVAEVLKDKAYLTSLIKKSECTWETETGETVEREVTKEVTREVTEEVDGEEVTRTITEEVTEIVTDPVKETHTEEFLGIAESNMIAILTKAIQELNAKVEALEAQLAK